jgi:hypothetical protein
MDRDVLLPSSQTWFHRTDSWVNTSGQPSNNDYDSVYSSLLSELYDACCSNLLGATGSFSPRNWVQYRQLDRMVECLHQLWIWGRIDDLPKLHSYYGHDGSQRLPRLVMKALHGIGTVLIEGQWRLLQTWSSEVNEYIQT